jgi:hypothetical protein
MLPLPLPLCSLWRNVSPGSLSSDRACQIDFRHLALMAQTTVTLYKPEQTGNKDQWPPGTELFGDDSFSFSAKAIGVGADGATTYVVWDAS